MSTEKKGNGKGNNDAQPVDLLTQICEPRGILPITSKAWLMIRDEAGKKIASIYVNRSQLDYGKIHNNVVESMKKYSPKYRKLPKRRTAGKHNLLVLSPTDMHFGKLAITEVSNAEYNLEIARERMISGIKELLLQAKMFGIKEILFVVGNDILHTDNTDGTTTKGTHQDTDSHFSKAFEVAQQAYIEAIELALSVADVRIVHAPSNHDYMTGTYLATVLSAWFRLNKNVTTDIDLRHRKYYQFGSNLIAISHGDKAKEAELVALIPQEKARMWADTRFRYVYLGHLHHKKVRSYISGKDYIGVTVEYLRSPSEADGWHNDNGYVSQPAMEAFIHSPENGQIARLTHYF